MFIVVLRLAVTYVMATLLVTSAIVNGLLFSSARQSARHVDEAQADLKAQAKILLELRNQLRKEDLARRDSKPASQLTQDLRDQIRQLQIERNVADNRTTQLSKQLRELTADLRAVTQDSKIQLRADRILPAKIDSDPDDLQNRLAITTKSENVLKREVRSDEDDTAPVSPALSVDQRNQSDKTSVNKPIEKQETPRSAPVGLVTASPKIARSRQLAGSLRTAINRLNIRTAPSIGATLVSTSDSGDVLHIIANAADAPWHKVRTDDGLTGYINTAVLLARSKSGVHPGDDNAPSALSVTQRNRLNKAPVDKLTVNQEAPPSNPAEVPSAPSELEQSQQLVGSSRTAINRLNVRAAPSIEAKLLSTSDSGVVLRILAIAPDVPWHKVRTNDGLIGYVNTSVLLARSK